MGGTHRDGFWNSKRLELLASLAKEPLTTSQIAAELRWPPNLQEIDRMSGEGKKPPFTLDMSFGEAVQRYAQTDPKEISPTANKISVLAPKSGSKEISPGQGSLSLEIEKDFDGIGMGVLSDGTPYLNQRGLAALLRKWSGSAHDGALSGGRSL